MKPTLDLIASAIELARTNLSWKPGSAERHLLKRKLRGHLPATATIRDYETIIQSVISDRTADVYAFFYGDTYYVAVVDFIADNCWLVMFDLNGVLETAYIVERPDNYLRKDSVAYIGSLATVLR